MADITQQILTQGQNLAIQYPTVDALQTFVANSTANQSNIKYMVTIAGAPANAVPKHQSPWERWADEIKKAVCTDFQYCSKKAEVQADLNKYLPDIIKALINNKVGQSGVSWITTVLAALGFVAGWEAAVATVVAYFIIKGLDEWCAC